MGFSSSRLARSLPSGMVACEQYKLDQQAVALEADQISHERQPASLKSLLPRGLIFL